MTGRIAVARQNPWLFHLVAAVVLAFAAFVGAISEDDARQAGRGMVLVALRPILAPALVLVAVAVVADYWRRGGMLLWVSKGAIWLGRLGDTQWPLKSVAGVELTPDRPSLDLILKDGTVVPISLLAVEEDPEQVRQAILGHLRRDQEEDGI